MYLYDVKTGKEKELVSGFGVYDIEEYSDGKLKYDGKEITLSLD